DRAGRRPGGPDLRSPDSRFLPIRRCLARKAEFYFGATRLGYILGAEAGNRHAALRPSVGAGQGLRRRLRDAALVQWGRPAAPGFAGLAIVPSSMGPTRCARLRRACD